MTNVPKSTINSDLFVQVSDIITQSRAMIKQTVNTAMVQAYWHIGRLIVEFEQNGNARAEYGKAQLQTLSVQLTEKFGKGFDITNLRRMRLFYLTFPKQDAMRLELSWTHYRALLRLENVDAREWCMNESVSQGWSARALRATN